MLRRLLVFGLVAFGFVSCGTKGSGAGEDVASDGGASDGGASDGGVADGSGDAGDGAGPPARLRERFESGALTPVTTPRSSFAGVKVRIVGDTAYVLEAVRDAEQRPSRRLAAYAVPGLAPRWQWSGDGEWLWDFAVHPSGAVTVTTERASAERLAYGLVRLDASGAVVARQILAVPTTLAPEELGTDLDVSMLRMKSYYFDAIAESWFRVEPRGEGVALAWMTTLEGPDGGGLMNQYASLAEVMAWGPSEYRESWARVVDGRHYVQPAGWAYDEFRWSEAAYRPLLAVDGDGTVVVGRTWSTRRCLSTSRRFAELDEAACSGEDVTSPLDVERQPLALTAFSSEGARRKTHVFLPRQVSEFVAFDMAVRNGRVAVAGTEVRVEANGKPAYYSASPGIEAIMVPYDGYVAIVRLEDGGLDFERRIDGGRGDYLATVRWLEDGILVGGAADWDRWNGGMSISRGADPLLAFVGLDEPTPRVKTVRLGAKDRHTHLFGVDATANGVAAVGPFEAPMTHSGDGGQTQNRTFGGLFVEIR